MRAALRMAEAARSEPPPRRGSPALREVPPGAWWRVHAFDATTQQCAPERFNATGLGNARFSPLQGPDGIIPTLYAASTLDSALMETVLHDVPTPSQGHIHDIDRDLRSNLHASSIDITAPLRLVDLTKIGLQRMGLRVTDLFETEAADYARTRRWAQWLHTADSTAQGLYWMSARQPECPAILLFGGRVPANAIRPGAALARPLSDATVYACLLSLLQRLGCGVSPGR